MERNLGSSRAIKDQGSRAKGEGPKMKGQGLRKIKENKAIYRKDVPYDIRERAFQFALRVVNFVRTLPRDIAAQTLGQQLLRSATSIGANIEEADGSTTAKDRTYKRA